MCSTCTSSRCAEGEIKLYIAWLPLALIRVFLLISCGFTSTILDKVPEDFLRQGCHLNKDVSFDDYRAMDNSCSGFGVGDHALKLKLKLKRRPKKGYGKTMSLTENE
jgi:hypothetical protein